MSDAFEEGEDAELGGVDGGIEVIGEDAIEIAGDAAAGDVGDAVKAAIHVIVEKTFEGLVVAGVGLEDGIEEAARAGHRARGSFHQ